MSEPLSSRVVQAADPRLLIAHRFGLEPGRWAELAGRGFWITGAGTGYGQALAVALAAAGCRVYLTGRRREKLLETAGQVQAIGIPAERVLPVPADVTDPGQVAEAVSVIARAGGGRLHGVVHAAALPQRSGPWPLLEDSLEAWDAMQRLNVTAALLVMRQAMPLMLATDCLRGLLLSSSAGWAAALGFGPYNVSKAALNSLSASLAVECANRYPALDVQINVLEPGEARTEMNQHSNVSPYVVASMGLLLLSHPPGGPNGRYFHRDGWHLAWGAIPPYDRPLNGP